MLGEGAEVGPFTAVVDARARGRPLRADRRGRLLHRRRRARAAAASSSAPIPARWPATCWRSTRLRLREDFNVLCPGHGPPVWDAHEQARTVRRPPHRPREPPDHGARPKVGARSRSCSTRSGPTCPAQLRPVADGDARRAPGQARGRAGPARRRRAARASSGSSGERAIRGGADRDGRERSRDRLAVPADRRLRLPVGLPHRRARRLRRLDRVDVPAPLRLALGVRRDARPRRRQLARRPLRRLRPGRAPLHPGHEHDRDDLDDAAGLAAGRRRADDRRRGTTTSTARATRARRPTTTPTTCWCG